MANYEQLAGRRTDDGLADAPNWETQTLAAAVLGTVGIARMLENWETQTGSQTLEAGGVAARSSQPII